MTTSSIFIGRCRQGAKHDSNGTERDLGSAATGAGLASITDSATLSEWMYPNDFELRVGHRFTFRMSPNPAAGFGGLVVRCEVLECDPPHSVAFSWSVGVPVTNMRVCFQLEADGEATRVLLDYSGFDVSQPRGEYALWGARFGWAKMLGLDGCLGVVAGIAASQH